jgi:5-formyltetrahydrofolate cyclo-ligase
MLAERNALPQDYRATASAEIAKRFIESFSQYKNYALYYSIGSEVDTRGLMKSLWSLGKTLFLPKTEGSVISFAEASPDGLVPGEMGIMEPTGEDLSGREEIIVVPGVCFDRNFYRIGYGKGCYDRYLTGSKAVKVGLCYKKLMVETVYPDSFDVAMDFVILG